MTRRGRRPFPFLCRAVSNAHMRVLLVLALLGAAGCFPVQDPGEGPIVAEAHTWTFIPFPASRCANGSATGIGVNLAPDSDELVLYLQGGGACASGEDCFGVAPTAANIESGYGEAQFQGEANLSGIVFIDRLALDNPYRDASFAFVPYCTGDLHAGDASASYDVSGTRRTAEHRGRHNLSLFLERLTATFPDLERVTLAGASAGGFGALFNASLVRERFAGVRVDVLSDSGPPVAVPDAVVDGWREHWSFAPPAHLLEELSSAQPSSRVGLLGSLEDAVLSLYAELPGSEWRALMEALRPEVDALPNAEAFVVEGQGHVVIANRLASSDGVSLSDWLAAFARDADDWRSAWP